MHDISSLCNMLFLASLNARDLFCFFGSGLFSCILYLHRSHNTPLLSPKNLHRHCFRLLLGQVHVPGEIANNEYAKFGGILCK